MSVLRTNGPLVKLSEGLVCLPCIQDSNVVVNKDELKFFHLRKGSTDRSVILEMS